MITRLISIATVLLVAGPGWSDVATNPFVAGFDRFADKTANQSAGGRLLLSELSCVACHAAESALLKPKRGPRLNGAGLRLQQAWLTQFLAAPHRVKPGTTMPDLLHGLPPAQKKQAIAALTAFLASQREPFPELKVDARHPLLHEFWNKGDLQHGRELFHRIGCVACHEPDKQFAVAARQMTDFENLRKELTAEEIDKLNLPAPIGSVPFGDLKAKYTHESLTHFLIDPAGVRPGLRMPNLQLSPDEAADITAYLLKGVSKNVKASNSVSDPVLIGEGRRLFVKLRCANCHDAGGVQPAHFARPLAKLDLQAGDSCLRKSAGGLPQFMLSQKQQDALQQVLSTWSKETNGATASQQVHFQMLQFNCYACHARDNLGGVGLKRRNYFETVGHVDIGDEGRLPPALDGVGARLQGKWLNQVLRGVGKVRPHIQARMPAYPAEIAATLQQALTRADEPPSKRKSIAGSVNLAGAGRKLMNTAGCILCHPIRGERLPGVVGIDLAGIDQRVTPHWFRDFLLEPSSLRPATRMPALFADGKSTVTSILDGDPERQVAAFWAYLKDIDRQPLPDKIAQEKVHNFEIVPRERPVLLRTFMKKAGPLAIAVGYPAKVHFAFDAEQMCLAQLWRGKFIDAHGTWYDRLAPPAQPLGVDIVDLPRRLPFALPGDGGKPSVSRDGQFGGYRLDKQGVPTFLYRFGPFQIEDCITPQKDGSLKRRLRITCADRRTQKLYFQAHVAPVLQSRGTDTYRDDRGLTVNVTGDSGHQGEILRTAKSQQWRISLDVQRQAVLEVRYQW